MKKIMLVVMSLFSAANCYALPSTTFSMICYIASQDDNWTYKDFGFTVSYKDTKGKQHTLSAKTMLPQKNCSTKSVSAHAAIPVGTLTFHINDFTGEAGSTIECTNAIKYKLTKQQIGHTCEFIVKSPKYGAYTSTDECSLIVDCRGGPNALSTKIPAHPSEKTPSNISKL